MEDDLNFLSKFYLTQVEIFSFFTTSPDGRAAWWAAGEINTKANSVQLNWGLGWAWQNDGKVG